MIICTRYLGISVYLYEKAATRPERRNLADVRRGEYEGIKAEIATRPEREPDFGPRRVGKAGATAIGARSPLIAFNVYLNTDDVEVAKAIARAVRHSSGGLRYVNGFPDETPVRPNLSLGDTLAGDDSKHGQIGVAGHSGETQRPYPRRHHKTTRLCRYQRLWPCGNEGFKRSAHRRTRLAATQSAAAAADCDFCGAEDVANARSFVCGAEVVATAKGLGKASTRSFVCGADLDLV